MEFIDYYKVLEIDKNADTAAIKKAYRRLARKYHPDLNPGDEAAKRKFQQINEANEVLSDPEKRKKYDRYGKDWQHAEAFEQAERERQTAGGGYQHYTYSGGDPGQFSDFFESMFGSGFESRYRERQSPRFKGQDLNATLRLNLTDVLTSRRQTIDLGDRKIRIRIPAGVEDGQTIRIKGYGGPGLNEGPPGDLYITFEILNNTRFKRLGSDLYAEEEISLYTAVLGGEITIETLDGKVKLNVSPGTQNGTRVKLRGKGIPVYKQENRSGDLYITYTVALPTNLTAEEKELFTKLSSLRK